MRINGGVQAFQLNKYLKECDGERLGCDEDTTHTDTNSATDTAQTVHQTVTILSNRYKRLCNIYRTTDVILRI